MEEFKVVAGGQSGTYRRTERSQLTGFASVVLTVTLAGVVYSVDVDVWDLDDLAVRGLGAVYPHAVTFGGRTYKWEAGLGLPAPVISVFDAEIRGVYALMVAFGVNCDDVLGWAVEREEGRLAAEKKAARSARRRSA